MAATRTQTHAARIQKNTIHLFIPLAHVIRWIVGGRETEREGGREKWRETKRKSASGVNQGEQRGDLNIV